MQIDNNNLPFSKRYGFEPVDIPFQIDSIDNILRTELWNAYYLFILNAGEPRDSYYTHEYDILQRSLWIHFFKKPLDDYPYNYSELKNFVRKHIENGLWNKVYEFFESLFRNIENKKIYRTKDFENYINNSLRNNNAGYTLTRNKFIRVTNEAEIEELKQTQSHAEQNDLSGIQEHLNSAIDFLSQKPKPDYRNSIKESISMVEVISRIIEPNENTLGKALNKLEKNEKINATLKVGFEKLYAYTNDKNGIRHALMEENRIDYEDAKFFLIACSSFTNYLIQKAKKENLLMKREK